MIFGAKPIDVPSSRPHPFNQAQAHARAQWGNVAAVAYRIVHGRLARHLPSGNHAECRGRPSPAAIASPCPSRRGRHIASSGPRPSGPRHRAQEIQPKGTMTDRVRIDRLLVERGLFESRAKAQAAIEAGLVVGNEMPVTKASLEFPADAVLRAESGKTFGSRGGVKLAAALDRFGFDPAAQICLDIGAPT